MRIRTSFDMYVPQSIIEQAAANGDTVLHNVRGWVADMLSEAFNSPSIHQQTAEYYETPAEHPFSELGKDSCDETQVRIVSIEEVEE